MMKKILYLFSGILFLAGAHLSAFEYVTLTASNLSPNNLLVYDIQGNLIQTAATGGDGGVSGNGGGVAIHDNLAAVVNYNSSTVSIFNYISGSFVLVQQIDTSAPPVSVAFGHDHLYILETNTLESFRIDEGAIESNRDGFATFTDYGPAQVGVLEHELVFTQKGSPGQILLAELERGALTGAVSSATLPPAPNNDTPFGLATRKNTGYITIAHSNDIAVLKHRELVSIIVSGNQAAPCWLTILNKWLFSSNAGSGTISRLAIKSETIIMEDQTAALGLGATGDIAAGGNLLAILGTRSGTTYLTQFRVGKYGQLDFISFAATPSTSTNGLAIFKD